MAALVVPAADDAEAALLDVSGKTGGEDSRASAKPPLVGEFEGSTGGSGDFELVSSAKKRSMQADRGAAFQEEPCEEGEDGALSRDLGDPVKSGITECTQASPDVEPGQAEAEKDLPLCAVPDATDTSIATTAPSGPVNSETTASSALATSPAHIGRQAPATAPMPPAEPRGCNFGGGLCELMVVEAIQEYMSFHGMDESLQSLREELESRAQATTAGRGGSVDSQGDGRVGAARHAVVGSELVVGRALADFDLGRRDAVFDVWNMLVPGMVADSPTGCALELRLRVHFGVFSARQALNAAAVGKAGPAAEGTGLDRQISANSADAPEHPVPRTDFEDLQAFLAAHPAANLDETAESLAPLFALPFVPQPHLREGFKFIFEDSWVQKLRADLQAFLTPHASARHAPMLRHLAGNLVIAKGPKAAPPPACWHELVRIADLGLAAAVKIHEVQQTGGGGGARKGANLFKDIAHARFRLASVAAQPDVAPPAPTSAQPQGKVLGSAGQGPELSPGMWPCSREAALRACSSSSLDTSYRDALRSPSKRLHSARNLESRARTATALLPVPPALDFSHIAAVIAGEKYLQNGAAQKQSTEDKDSPAEAVLSPPLHAVLRAVLRRLASPDEPVRPRRTFLAAFACFGALRTLAGRLGDIIASGDAIVTELALAVLAVCACEAVGRKEIEQAEGEKPGCIIALVTVLQRSPVGSPVHIQCLAVLQRLSLRRRLQSNMIALGAVDWVLQTLRSISFPDLAVNNSCEGPGSPDFSLEFASALLMNLTLRCAGRKRCNELGAYETLVGLIEHPNPQVRTHVNGSLYSLLGVASFRAAAQEQNAEATFKAALMRVADGDGLLTRQLEYLLTQLNRTESSEDDEDSDGDVCADGDVDDGENFLDEEELAGHFLLVSSAACAAAAERAAAGVIAAGAGGDTAVATTAAEAAAASAAAAAEAVAAEEALRLFRASPAIADAQQRRFHAFIACSAGGLCSPIGKRRSRLGNLGNGEQRLSTNSELYSSPSPYGLGLGPLLSTPSPPPLLEESNSGTPRGVTDAACNDMQLLEEIPPSIEVSPPVGLHAAPDIPNESNRAAPRRDLPPRQEVAPSRLRPPRARNTNAVAGNAAPAGAEPAVPGGAAPSRAPGVPGASGGRGRAPAVDTAKGGARSAASAPPPMLPPLVGPSASSSAAPPPPRGVPGRSRSYAPPRDASKPGAGAMSAAEATAAAAEAALAAGGAGGSKVRRLRNPAGRNPPAGQSGPSSSTPRGGPRKSSGASSLPQLPMISQRRGG